jgi:hypothetical protein
VEGVVRTDVNFHLEERMDQKMDIDENPLHLCSGGVVMVPSAPAFDHFWVSNPPVLAICYLLSSCRMVWTLLLPQSC